MSNIYFTLGLFLIISNLDLGVTQWLPTYEAFRDEKIDDLNGTNLKSAKYRMGDPKSI